MEKSIDISGDMKPTNPKDVQALKKLDLSLFPQTAIVGGTLAMTEGDCKYGGHNYRVGGVLASVYIAALLRHTFQFTNGEWADERTKVPHLCSMIACPSILYDAHVCGVLRDDRPPRADVSKLLTNHNEIAAHLKKLFPNGPARFTETGRKKR